MLSLELIEDLASLNRTHIPEPVLHAKGAGAYGVFYPYMSMKDYTKANFLQNTSIETPVFVRFSKMMGRPGSADTERGVRGFSVRFMTKEGRYDLSATHIPVSFIRDPNKYPSLILALSPCARTNMKSPEKLWSFVAENPETMHMITWLYSDRGTLKSYRTMEGYSVHVYVWQNSREEQFWVRYHWKPLLGTADISRQEAEFLAGFDPDAASRDLYDALDRGEQVSFELCVQLISISQNADNESSLLDPVCVWPESLVPSLKIGKMILRKAVENHVEEVESVTFSPANLVSGIALSSEPLLSALVFASCDEERYRLKNATLRSRNPLKVQAVNSGPSSFGECGVSSSDQLSWRLKSMKADEKEKMFNNIAEELLFLDDKVKHSIVNIFSEAGRELGTSLEKRIAL